LYLGTAEFTFSTGACKREFDLRPRVLDGLLYAVEHAKVPAEVVTPEFVEKTINNKSWMLLTSNVNGGKNAHAFPSPVDLCESIHIIENLGLKKEKCYEAARKVVSSPLRCFLLSATFPPGSIRSVGASTYNENDDQLNVLECTSAFDVL